MKRILAASILILSSIIFIPASSGAITCPTGSVISSTDATKCIKFITTTEPISTVQTSYCEPNGAGKPAIVLVKRSVALGGDYCNTPSYVVPAQSYQGTTVYITYCPIGYTEYDASTCSKSTPFQRVDDYSPAVCPAGTSATNATTCAGYNGYLYYTPKVFPACPTGSSRSGNNCVYAETQFVQYTPKETGTNGLVQCIGYQRFADVGCQNDAYTVASLDTAAKTTTTGICAEYYVYDSATLNCKAFIYDPTASISTVIYKCTERTQGIITNITYYNSDATVIGANGRGRTCEIFSDVNPRSSDDGIFFCTITQNETGFKYYYQSTVDATGSNSLSTTDCDFVYVQEESILPDDETPNTQANDPCSVYVNFNLYVQCLRAQYV